jgi:hypothetical protein
MESDEAGRAGNDDGHGLRPSVMRRRLEERVRLGNRRPAAWT